MSRRPLAHANPCSAAGVAVAVLIAAAPIAAMLGVPGTALGQAKDSAPPRPGAATPAKNAEKPAPAIDKPAAKPAPKKLTAAEIRRRKKVQAQAAAILAKIVRTEPGDERYKLIDALLDLGDAAWPVAQKALPKLATVKESEPVVVDVLLGFMDMSYEALIAQEPKLSDGAAGRVLKFVSRQIEHDDRFYRLLASMSKRSDPDLLPLVMGELLIKNWPGAVQRCIELIDHTDAGVQVFAIDQLATIKHKPAQPYIIRRLGIEQRQATPNNLTFRIKLINAIARLGGEESVSPLIEALDLRDQEKYALDGLRLVGMPAVKHAVLMLTTAQGQRIEVAFRILQHIRILAAPELVRLLEAGSNATRAIALDVLTHLNVPNIRDEVIRMVKERRFVDPTDGIRLAVGMYNQGVRGLLFDMLEDPNPELRRMVVDQLWRLRDPKTFRVLRAVAGSDKDANVRLHALQAVAGVGDPKGPRLLRKMLRVPHPHQRQKILEVLGRVDTWQSAVPAIAELLGDPNHKVFLAALGTLRRMTFHSGPQRTAGWKAWHRRENSRAKEEHELVRPITRRFVVGDREMGYLEAGEGQTIVVVSGPPFRDATHLAPHVWRLASDYRVAVMQRAPGPYDARLASTEERERELQGMLGRLAVRPVVLMTDASGAHFALRFAQKHKRDVSKVILHGAFWPTRKALEASLAQVSDAVRQEMRDDLRWGFYAQWRVPAEVRNRTIFRAGLSGLLSNWEHGRRVRTDNLADDAFEVGVLDRMRAEYRSGSVSKVRKPVLLLLGNAAPWAKTTLEDVAELKKKSKRRVRVVKVPKAGWMPLLENPDATMEAIESFLD